MRRWLFPVPGQRLGDEDAESASAIARCSSLQTTSTAAATKAKEPFYRAGNNSTLAWWLGAVVRRASQVTSVVSSASARAMNVAL
jgi:hypothetical protein